MSTEADGSAPRPAADPARERTDLAPIGRRVGAEAIDVAIISVIVIGVSIVTGTLLTGAAARGDVGAYLALSGVVGLVFAVLGLAWLLLLSAWHSRGGSPGQRAMGIALRRRGDGAHLSFGAALGRILVFRLSTIILVGYFTPLFDGSGLRQGWHDKVVDAVMIDLRAAPAAAADAVPAASARPTPPAPPAQPVLTGSGILPPAAVSPRSGGLNEPAVPPPLPPLPFPPATVSQPAGVPIPDGLVSEVPGVVRATAPSVEPGSPAHAAAPVPESLAVPAAPPTAPSAPPAAVTPPPAMEDEADIDATRHVAPRRVSDSGVIVVWDDGVSHAVTSIAVFGRNPESADDHASFAVPDATRSLSKTHFELVVEADGVWIIDRHSTNGTSIDSGGVRRSATAGERVRVQLGDTVVIGDRSFTLREPA